MNLWLSWVDYFRARTPARASRQRTGNSGDTILYWDTIGIVSLELLSILNYEPS